MSQCQCGGPSSQIPYPSSTRWAVTPRLSAIAPKGCPHGAARRITRRFHRLSASGWWVAYALRTRPPLSRPPKGPLPYDLHVLGLPLAFILSQDQTLRCSIVFLFFLSHGLRFTLFSTFSGSLSPASPSPSRAPGRGTVLASSSQRSFAKPLSVLSPPSRVLRVQKYSFFHYWQHFFYLFFLFYFISLIHKKKNIITIRKSI